MEHARGAAATTSSASAAANMASVSVLGDLPANGQAAVRDGSLDAMAAASTASAAAALVVLNAYPAASPTAAVVLPERFSYVSSRGLPKAVIDQLNHTRSLPRIRQAHKFGTNHFLSCIVMLTKALTLDTSVQG